MSVQTATPAVFKEEAKAALAKPQLKVALDRATNLLQRRRVEVMAQFPEFQTARDQGAAIKDHTLKYLDHYLEQFDLGIFLLYFLKYQA